MLMLNNYLVEGSMTRIQKKDGTNPRNHETYK